MITLVIIVATTLVSWRAFGDRRLMDRLILWPPAIGRYRQYDRLLTYGFVHADWPHLLFNMITLFFFGQQVERVAGLLPFLLFYLSAIVVAILPAYLRHKGDAHYRSLGASGGVSAVLFAFIMLSPWSKIVVFPIPFGIPAIAYAVLYVAYSVWMDRQGGDNVNHSAHLFGALYGAIFITATQPGTWPAFLGQIGL